VSFVVRTSSSNAAKVSLLIGFAIALIGGGCAQPASPISRASGLSEPSRAEIVPWTFDGRPGKIVKTDHYQLHTTIQDPDTLHALAQVMEGALDQYQRLTPGLTLTDRPMECFVFARRYEWMNFTQQHTGSDAEIYLKINRGGYTVRDWYAAYFIGDQGTYAVASHEGWHQYVARHFRSRLPPFLEEGIATMFENISWTNGNLPRWNTANNPNRADKLQNAIEDGSLWPLEALCKMHAGDVLGLKGERIETFYAQNWAFAQFLWNAEGGKYRPAFQRMLTELATGQADTWIGRRRGPIDTWDPRTVRPLLEHYLGMNMKQIDSAYQAYIRQVAYGTRQPRMASSSSN
jgi:hypothetical protein